MTNKKTYKRIPVEYPMGYLAGILFVHSHQKWNDPVFHYSCSSKVIIFCRFAIFVIYIRIGYRLVS